VKYRQGVFIPIPSEKLAVSNRFLDFWLLGGASILFFVVMWILNLSRAEGSEKRDLKVITELTSAPKNIF
jgi:hypothetical protein